MLSDLYFIVNYYVLIISAIISLPICLLTIVIVITHRQCRNFTNLLSCNTCVAVSMFFIFVIVKSIYGLRGDWQYHQPACVYRAYCTLALRAVLCYSYSIQAISRLFFAIFYKYRYLLTWRAHWILIIFNWVISIVIPLEPLFHENGFSLELESHVCAVNHKIVSVSFYVVGFVFIVPLNVVTIVYGVILYHVHQSSRRVTAFVPNHIIRTTQAPVANGKRDLKLRTNMLIQSSFISFGGILYLIVTIWNVTPQNSPPESLYLLSHTLISVFTAFMMITLVLMNKPVKAVVWSYVFRPIPTNNEHLMTRRQPTRFNAK